MERQRLGASHNRTGPAAAEPKLEWMELPTKTPFLPQIFRLRRFRTSTPTMNSRRDKHALLGGISRWNGSLGLAGFAFALGLACLNKTCAEHL